MLEKRTADAGGIEIVRYATQSRARLGGCPVVQSCEIFHFPRPQKLSSGSKWQRKSRVTLYASKPMPKAKTNMMARRASMFRGAIINQPF
jgi:hypothetical protein